MVDGGWNVGILRRFVAEERECSVHGGERWHEGRVVDVQELEPDTAVRLVRRNAVR